MRSSITLTIITAILAASIQSVIAKRANQGQLLANTQLSDKQTNDLKSLGVKVAIPSYIPPGFQVTSVEVQPCSSERIHFCPDYAIIYRNSNNSCFAIESTSGNVGDTSANLERSYPFNNSIFGKSAVLKYRKNDRPVPTLIGSWMGKSPFYRFTGAGSRFILGIGVKQLSNCQDISPQEAIRVSESLRYLP